VYGVCCSPGVYGVSAVAQVNPNMPRTFGDGVIHKSHFDALVEVDHPLPEIHNSTATDEEERIGKFVADNLVMDGATIQMGLLSFLASVSVCVCVSICLCRFVRLLAGLFNCHRGIS